MEITLGGIYDVIFKDNQGKDEHYYRLVIGDVWHNGEYDELFVYSIMGENEADLVVSGDIAMEHPSQNWHFVRLATPEEFKKALVNFRTSMKEYPNAINYDYERELGQSSPHK